MAIIGNGITTGAAGLDGMITVSDTQPTIPSNKVWVKETPGEIEIPTVDELEELKGEFESTVDYTESYNTVSGDIVSFDDGVAGKSLHKLLGTIEPVQDLHGYENPWPAGGGINKIDPNNISLYTSSIYGLALSQTGGVVKAVGTWNSQTAGSARAIVVDPAIMNYNVKCFESSGHVACRWQSGDYVIVFDFTNMVNGQAYDFTIYPIVYEGSTAPTEWTPYSNICPISGHTGVEVTRAGKNLIDKSHFVYGNTDHQFVWGYRREGFLLKGGVSYIFSASNAPASMRLVSVDESKVYAEKATTTTVRYTPTEDTLVVFRLWNGAGQDIDAMTVSLEIGSTVTEYEEYRSEVIPISWQSKAGTVYGGTVDPANGKLIATHAMVDMGTLNWYYVSTRGIMEASPEGVKPFPNNDVASCLCSQYKSATYGVIYDNSQDKAVGIAINGRIYVYDSAYTDAASFKAAMSGVQLVYELATPIEYNLSSRAIKTLSGQNNIWIDTGSITECEYVTATGSVIDKLLPEATDEDIGKALLVKTVEDGRVTEYELGDVKEDLSSLAHVITDTASGDIATFTDGADNQPIQKLVATIEPVQDLHGYENPWPAGGGKNLIDPSAKTKYSNTIYEWYQTSGFTLEANTTYTLSSTAGASAGVYIMDFETGSAIVSGHATETYTPTEDITVYFRMYKVSDADTVDIMLEKSSTATSFAPYSNECPISGYTGLIVTRTGKNLFDKTKPLAAGLINASGEVVENASYQHPDYYTKVNPSTAYVFSGGIVESGIYNSVVFYDKDKTFINRFVPSSDGVGASFTTPANCTYIKFNTANSHNINLDTIQLEEGSTASTYEPYTGTTIPISWQTEAGTIYGGTDEVIGGALESTMGMVDLGTLNWSYNSGALRFDCTNSNTLGTKIIAGDVIPNACCTIYKGVQFNNNYGKTGPDNVFFFDGGLLRVRNKAYTDNATFKAAMSGVQLCYELATPVEYALSANELTTLYGTNNVWTDAGPVEVNYPADTKLYIDKKISEAVAALGS